MRVNNEITRYEITRNTGDIVTIAKLISKTVTSVAIRTTKINLI